MLMRAASAAQRLVSTACTDKGFAQQWHSIASLRHAASDLASKWETSPDSLLQGHFTENKQLLSSINESPASAAAELLMHYHTDGLRVVREWRAAVLKQTTHKTGSTNESLYDVASLQQQDLALQAALASAFGRTFLSLQRISLTSPGYLLDFLAATEKVHPAKTFLRLKQKLGENRRVLALTHSAAQDGLPSAIIHAALTPNIAHSMAYLNTHTGGDEHIPSTGAALQTGSRYPPSCSTAAPEKGPLVANFYSVSVTDPALKGTGLATTLIMESAAALQAEFPSLERFVTLSPVPLFMRWLQQASATAHSLSPGASADEVGIKLAGDAGAALLPPLLPGADGSTAGGLHTRLEQLRSLAQASAAEGSVGSSEEAVHFHKLQWRERVLQSQGDLLHLLRWYIAFAKHTSGRPHCPTAAFHLSNGATLRCVNFMGNLSPQGMRESGSLMVNYEYELEALPGRADRFHSDSAAVAADLWTADWQQREDADTALMRR